MSDLDSLRRDLEGVRERVTRAAERAGRRPEDILLIGVSKTVTAERIRLGVEAGLTALGENRVQEAREKIKILGRPVPWHLIGHLQTNKVRDALELFDLIHSLDRMELAREIDRRAGDPGRVVDTLLEVNVAAEPSKGGFAPDAVEPALEAIAGLPHLRVRGLMAIPPVVEHAEEVRPWFQALRRLAERHGLRELSMGMSADFEVAIEEGATMVRVGTAIFGSRPARPAPARSPARQIASAVTKRKLLISIAAGVSTTTIRAALGKEARLIRVMPNTPALVLEGVTAVAKAEGLEPGDLDTAGEIFSAVGRVVTLDEELMDAVTGLSGSGPAYVAVVVESLADGGVKMGLDRITAMTLATQTVLGAARLMLETGLHPGALKDMVSSPGGTTIAGIAAMEEGGIRNTLIKAVERATQRSRELGRGPA